MSNTKLRTLALLFFIATLQFSDAANSMSIREWREAIDSDDEGETLNALHYWRGALDMLMYFNGLFENEGNPIICFPDPIPKQSEIFEGFWQDLLRMVANKGAEYVDTQEVDVLLARTFRDRYECK